MKNMLIILLMIVKYVTTVMITKECPYEETHVSCSFYEEYTCWETERRLIRVKTPAKRLAHCWAGCMCRKGTVRAYPQGPCVPGTSCVDRYLASTISKLPTDFHKKK